MTTSPRHSTLDASSDDKLLSLGYVPTLRRTLRTRDMMLYGIVFMVPIAPFGIFGSVYQAASGMVALAYLAGLVVMLLTASSYAQMSTALPAAGSVYSYAGRSLGAPVGFLAGWVALLDYFLIPGLLALIAAVAVNAFVPGVPVWAFIAGFVVATFVLNAFGMKLTKTATRWFLVGQIIVLFIFIVYAVREVASGDATLSFDAFYNSSLFTPTVLGAAVSIASLSFIGFDAVSLLAEDNAGTPKQVGRAMAAALGLTGLLFVIQTWLACMLVPNGQSIIANGDPDGTAFYDAARVAGGAWLATLCALATALAWGIANTMVAQVATTRLLMAMARDKQLPAFLGKLTAKRKVPLNALTAVAAISLALGIYMATRSDGIALLASMVNFGAIISFTLVHVSVLVYFTFRAQPYAIGQGVRWNAFTHLVIPVTGAGLLAFVAYNANVLAQRVALTWVGIGVCILVVMVFAGRSPRLAQPERERTYA